MTVSGWALNDREMLMLAPFATLAFLVTFWMLARILLEMSDGAGAKVIAALRGQSMMAQPPQSVRQVTVRFRPRSESVRRPVHVQPEWRAAA